MDARQLYIVDSTLREGEQFAHAHFTTQDKVQIASRLDAFGVDYIELTSPRASEQARLDASQIAQLNLNAKILTHIRCDMRDAELALACGVDGVNMMFGTSRFLRDYSHGRDIDAIIRAASDVIELLQGEGVEIRFSAEDSLRTDRDDLYRVYQAVDALGLERVGVADTVGIGSPHEIYDLVNGLRQRVRAGIEFHGHNDTGCAIANAFAAWQAGAAYIDTTVLGIGERNGIASLSGFIARVHATHPEHTKRYHLGLLPELDRYVGELTGVGVPFNQCITGSCAFVHKAGIHTKAVLNNPSTYEVLSPADFGLERRVLFAHSLTGRHALAHRARELGVALDGERLNQLTSTIKDRAAINPMASHEVDALLQQAAETTTLAPL